MKRNAKGTLKKKKQRKPGVRNVEEERKRKFP